MRIGFASTLLCAVTLSLVGLAGCGFKTEPVPPQNVVPRPIDDLSYAIDDAGVTLTWTYPEKTVKGDELTEIYSFDVYRAVVPLDDLCDTCPIPFGEPTEIPGGATADSGKRKIGEYQTSLLRPDHKYFYKMTSRISWWAASADSNIVSFVWQIPPAVPSGFGAVAEDGRIMLSWQPVTTLVDGSSADRQVLYQVSRSEGGKEFARLGEPIDGTTFTDSDVVNGKKYFYKVQSLMMLEKDRISGGVSEIVDATPIDTTPPAVPSAVRATATKQGNRVYWDHPGDPSVAGHRVYRRSAKEAESKLIGEVKMPASIYLDKDVPADTRVYYSVTAIDTAKPANESAPSKEATVR
jgi:hypothetical protein